MNTNQRAWDGFSKGTKTVPSPKAGQKYLAYLLPASPLSYGDFGDYVTLSWNVFVPSEDGTRRYLMTEIASIPNEELTENHKIAQRLAAVNGLSTSQVTDWSLLNREGYAIVGIELNKGGFTSIAYADALPTNYAIPADVVDNPEKKQSELLAMSAQQQDGEPF